MSQGPDMTPPGMTRRQRVFTRRVDIHDDARKGVLIVAASTWIEAKRLTDRHAEGGVFEFNKVSVSGPPRILKYEQAGA